MSAGTARPASGKAVLHRDVWHLAAPIILANVSTPLLGAVDTAVVGHLPGPHYIGAVAIGSLIFSFVYWGFGFLRMGTTGFVAQAIGAEDANEARAVLGRAFLIAIALGLLVVALQWPIAETAFRLIDAGERIEPLAEAYFDIRIWGAPAALANYVFVGWFVGARDTRSALIMALAMNLANIVLDLWFVVGLDMGVAGVAWASLIAEVGAIAVGIALIGRNLRTIGGVWHVRDILERAPMRRLFAVNRDIFIRTLGLQLAFALFTALGARMGDALLAANAVLLNFQGIMAYALDGFAHAVEALAGGFLGAGDRHRFRRAVWISSTWAAGMAVLFSAAYALLGGPLIDLITDIAEIRVLAREYLIWAVALPLLSVWSFQLDGIFIGATRTREMRGAMLVSVAVYALALGLLVPPFANHGLWAALCVLMIARAVTLGLKYPALERSVGG